MSAKYKNHFAFIELINVERIDKEGSRIADYVFAFFLFSFESLYLLLGSTRDLSVINRCNEFLVFFIINYAQINRL